jgi:CubicO group peptidase (beta-lactamase class C family)
MAMSMGAGLFLSLATSALSAPRAEWQPVADAVDAFALLGNVHVTIGSAAGILFEHQKGSTGLDTSMRLYSATKWVSGVTVMAAVERGHLGLDDPASAHL